MTQRFDKLPDAQLSNLLGYEDYRIRLKAQFELVARGAKGLEILKKAIVDRKNQFARIHAIWGIGQFAQKEVAAASALVSLLNDTDEEIVAQTLKTLGDVRYAAANDKIIPLINHAHPRVRFFATQAIGRIKDKKAIDAIFAMVEKNNDEDVYLRHAAVIALSRIGEVEPILQLKSKENKSLRLLAVLVLRKWRHKEMASFLQDEDEFIATEAARAINDDLSIIPALPALAAMLEQSRFTNEPLIRRAINACLRVGGEKELDLLIAYAEKQNIPEDLKAEALSVIGTWANPSVLDRVDGRFRGELKRDAGLVQTKIKNKMVSFLQSNNPAVLISSAKLLTALKITDYNETLAAIFNSSENAEVRAAALASLGELSYPSITEVVKKGINDKERTVRTTALGLINKLNVHKDELPFIVNPVFELGSLQEQQQVFKVLSQMSIDNTRVVLTDLIDRMANAKLSPNVKLDLIESVEATNDADLLVRVDKIKGKGSETDQYNEALYGGNVREGRNIFLNHSAAQCIRCHAIGDGGSLVGPDLKNIGRALSREQILQSLIEPSARIAPGFGMVSLILADGQEVSGVLMRENAEELLLKTSAAEPLRVPISRIKSRENFPSAMPAMGSLLSKREIRDLVEYLSSL
jgi:putative heme-binding domain-containing protein